MTEPFDLPPSGFSPADDLARLEGAVAGIRVWPIELNAVADKAGLMSGLADDLDLPDWFGRNWDALADLLGDPGQLGERAALLFHGLDGLRTRNPRLAGDLVEVCLDSQREFARLGHRLWLLEEPPVDSA